MTSQFLHRKARRTTKSSVEKVRLRVFIRGATVETNTRSTAMTASSTLMSLPSRVRAVAFSRPSSWTTCCCCCCSSILEIRRAAEQVPGTFVYSIPFGGNKNKSVVLASTAIQLLDDRKSPIVASVGIQMKLDFFQRKFWTASRQCAALDGKCTISCDNEDCKCYLIDNNGFILVTEDYSQLGLFFGEVEGAVMNKLLLMGSFKRITLYDYQALCREYAGSTDSSCSFSHPFSIVKWLLTELVMGKTMMVPCDTEYPAFVSERNIKETTGNIDCEGCARSFVIQQIPSSNLFMVVVDNKCDCSSAPLVSMDPIEIIISILNPSAHNDCLKCDRLKFQKDRKRPESCHPFHPETVKPIQLG
ncbi:unnamed protein product, partial [Coregonus sp. 'balchen']